tara:strand:- start:432 stop:1262 length:831 start_codon:yes stop_codon:yes gene_type:complete
MISTSKIGVSASRVGGGGAVTPHVFILDEYPAYAAFSLQKLSASYSGSAIRVRRSSDNAEQDIGFTNNNLDSSSLLTFVGAGDGFVTTAYNQLNVAYNFTQTTANSQPKIVSSGALITDINGLASIQFDGVDDFLFSESINWVTQLDSYQVGSTSDTKFIMISGAADKFSFVADSGSTNTALHSNYGSPSLYVNNVLKAPSNRGDVHNEISIGTPSVVNHLNVAHTAWLGFSKIGSYWVAGAWEYNGLIQEFIFYNTNTTSDRSAITTILTDKYVP